MRIKKQPKILALHLKRFKYIENDNRYKKLTYRVVFPLELRLFITSENANNPECLYSLISVVVHCGNGPNKGHYICAVKSHDFWLIFDDDVVEKVDEKSIEDFFGNENPRNSNGLEVGYILFYEAMDNDTALHPYSAPPHPSRTAHSVPSHTTHNATSSHTTHNATSSHTTHNATSSQTTHNATSSHTTHNATSSHTTHNATSSQTGHNATPSHNATSS